MSRDYAKRSSFRKKSRKSYLFLWLVILLLCAAFVTSLIMPDKYQKYGDKLREIGFIKKILDVKPQALSTKAIKKEVAIKKTETHALITKTITTPKFDFYNILPQKKDNKVNTLDKPEISYELSIATVSDFAAADHLKAELALLGFAASITPIYQNNIQKHHVSIGPYDDKESALIKQKKLKENGIKSELKKVNNL